MSFTPSQPMGRHVFADSIEEAFYILASRMFKLSATMLRGQVQDPKITSLCEVNSACPTTILETCCSWKWGASKLCYHGTLPVLCHAMCPSHRRCNVQLDFEESA